MCTKLYLICIINDNYFIFMKNLSYFILFILFFPNVALAYIDPASGSVVMSIIIGMAVMIGVFFKTLWYRFKSLVGLNPKNPKPIKVPKNPKNI